MPEKYFATVMKKTPLGENEFMFTPESVTAGDIDPKTRVLTTYTQDRYIPITALDSKEENIAGYYTNPLETEKVNEVFRKDVWTEAVEEYNERALQLVYYVVKQGEDAIVSVIDRAKLLKTAADVKGNKKQAEELKSEQPIAEQDEQYPEEDEKETMLDPTDIVQLLDDYNDYDENKLTEIIKVLVEKVIDGKLSPDQLTDLQEIFQEVISEAESAVESVKLQRETIEHEMAPAVEKTQPRVPTPQPLTVKKEETTKLYLKEHRF